MLESRLRYKDASPAVVEKAVAKKRKVAASKVRNPAPPLSEESNESKETPSRRESLAARLTNFA